MGLQSRTGRHWKNDDEEYFRFGPRAGPQAIDAFGVRELSGRSKPACLLALAALLALVGIGGCANDDPLALKTSGVAIARQTVEDGSHARGASKSLIPKWHVYSLRLNQILSKAE